MINTSKTIPVTKKTRLQGKGSLDPGKAADEYFRYIDFLSANGALKEDVEQLGLEDLSGVSGLKALRVEVNLHAPATKRPAPTCR